MTQHAIAGVLPVVHMPYTESGEIDLNTMEKQIDYLFATGANGFCLALVSDLFRLSEEERVTLPAQQICPPARPRRDKRSGREHSAGTAVCASCRRRRSGCAHGDSSHIARLGRGRAARLFCGHTRRGRYSNFCAGCQFIRWQSHEHRISGQPLCRIRSARIIQTGSLSAWSVYLRTALSDTGAGGHL